MIPLRRQPRGWLILVALVCLTSRTWAADATNAATNGATKAADLTSTGSVVTLPGIAIHHGKEKSVEVTGKVSLADEGMLEFLAVEPKGREYESMLTLNCKPSVLQFALLLIGLEPGGRSRDVFLGGKSGTLLTLEVEWQKDGKTQRVPVEKLMMNRGTRKSPDSLTWVFTGSGFVSNPVTGKQMFVADMEQAFIAVWWNPGVLINLDGEHGNPYQGNDQGFVVNTATVPPKDTPIKLIIRRRQ